MHGCHRFIRSYFFLLRALNVCCASSSLIALIRCSTVKRLRVFFVLFESKSIIHYGNTSKCIMEKQIHLELVDFMSSDQFLGYHSLCKQCKISNNYRQLSMKHRIFFIFRLQILYCFIKSFTTLFASVRKSPMSQLKTNRGLTQTLDFSFWFAPPVGQYWSNHQNHCVLLSVRQSYQKIAHFIAQNTPTGRTKW